MFAVISFCDIPSEGKQCIVKKFGFCVAKVFIQCNAPLGNTSPFRIPEFVVNYENIVIRSFGCQGNSAKATDMENILLDYYRRTRK